MSPKKGKRGKPREKSLPPEGWRFGQEVWDSFSPKEQVALREIGRALRAEHQLTPEQLHRRTSPFDRRIPLGFEKALGKKGRAQLDEIRNQLEAERRAAQQAPRAMWHPDYFTKFNPKDPRTKPPKINSGKPQRPQGSRARNVRRKP